jgi:hypothetical protein
VGLQGGGQEVSDAVHELQDADDVVRHVAVVGAERVGDHSPLVLEQVQDLAERHDSAPELDHSLLEIEDALLQVRVDVVGEHTVLDLL